MGTARDDPRRTMTAGSSAALRRSAPRCAVRPRRTDEARRCWRDAAAILEELASPKAAEPRQIAAIPQLPGSLATCFSR